MDRGRYGQIVDLMRISCLHGIGVDLLMIVDPVPSDALPPISLPPVVQQRESIGGVSSVPTEELSRKLEQHVEKLNSAYESFKGKQEEIIELGVRSGVDVLQFPEFSFDSIQEVSEQV